MVNFGLMKRFGLLILSALCLGSPLSAQTLESGKKLFGQGDYGQAKPIMLKYLKQKPQDASRNYWYGVCCLETGEQASALPYLELAAQKKIFKAYRALGDYYIWAEDYPMAISSYETYVSLISADRTQHDEAVEARYTFVADSLKTLYRMIRNTQKVFFIDSIVTGREQLFNSYSLSESAGTIAPAGTILGAGETGESFIPESRQSIIYSSAPTDSSQYALYTRYRAGDSWDRPETVQGLETGGSLRYPFIMNDGVTIYFASDGPESAGGYDIFVSRMNPATGGYYKPDNIGMPFNSSANDYLYVIDEDNDLGWFATDRGMTSADSVCIYIFVPSLSGQRYNYETEDRSTILSAAKLSSIASTQTDADALRAARQRLILLRYSQNDSKMNSFDYIIDDYSTYHELTDFQSPEARDRYQEWTGLSRELEQRQQELDDRRMQYHEAGTREKERMSGALLQLEGQVLELERKVMDMEKQVRALELNHFKK